MNYDVPFQLAHSGNGGMTTSLAQGIAGTANQRRLAMFPLSPMLLTGRSGLTTIAKGPLLDPRRAHTHVSAGELQELVNSQWYSRTRPVNSRAQIQAILGK
jgi:hypothetical protein